MDAKQRETKSRTRSFLKGVGSVVDIFPSTRFEKFIPKKTMEERMAEDWEKVGQSIYIAISKYEKAKARDK
ncbi:MAG: hypothetical protein NTX45_19165 [Proteobacteria bacterium]|nr:hypothetical protein [Pseudomonadota bacterium]